MMKLPTTMRGAARAGLVALAVAAVLAATATAASPVATGSGTAARTPRAYVDTVRTRVDLRREIGPATLRRMRRTGVPVLFPNVYRTWAPGPMAVEVAIGPDGWDIAIHPVPDCRSDSLNCPAFFIRGDRGLGPLENPNVRLFGGVRGAYQPKVCEDFCNDPIVDFNRRGVSYRFSGPVLGTRKRSLLALANQALQTGPR